MECSGRRLVGTAMASEEMSWYRHWGTAQDLVEHVEYDK